MMNVGFIGTGSMGSILIEAMIQSGSLLPEQIAATNRTYSKVERLALRYPGLKALNTVAETAASSDIVFLCIKPMEFKKVIDELQNVVTPAHIIVSITSPVQISQLESLLPCKIAKVIPSITNYVCSGASLCIYGERMQHADIALVDNMLRPISMPIAVDERYTRVTSDISSCGPAFIAFFVQKLVDAAALQTGIPRDEAIRLASEMVLGTGKLLTVGGLSPEALQQRVAVPGGITAEALQLLQSEMNGVFDQLIRKTHAKYDEDCEKVEQSFFGQSVE